jgi:hypothetical protein
LTSGDEKPRVDFIRTSFKVLLVISAGCHAPPPPAGAVDAASDAVVAAAPDAGPDAAPLPPQTTRLRIVNRCGETIWIAPIEVELAPGGFHDVDIPDEGLASQRYWPKVGCNAAGDDCAIGENYQPPIDSKFEATFAPIGSNDATFYNLSLVDGYTLPFSVRPVGDGAGSGSCVASDCTMLTVDACPSAEDLGDGTIVDLRLDDLGCMSPCKAWNYPPPYGLGQPESEDPGLHLCCPAPFTPEACRDAGDPLSVVHTDYVALVHARCPTAYSYSYDDAAGLHACPASTGFELVFCH